jgi:hypothetical protein
LTLAAGGTTAQKRKRPANGARNAAMTLINLDDDDDDSGPDEAVLNSRRVGRLVGDADVTEARNRVDRKVRRSDTINAFLLSFSLDALAPPLSRTM